MKVMLVVWCALCTTAAFGQAGVGASALNAEPQIVQFYSHARQAIQQPLAVNQNLLASSEYTYAQGERPLWEVAPRTVPTPLGDIARALKQERAAAKKAVRCWEN